MLKLAKASVNTNVRFAHVNTDVLIFTAFMLIRCVNTRFARVGAQR